MTDPINQFWLTPARCATRCDDCGHFTREGQPVVYRHDPKHVMCQSCADQRGVDYGLSKAYTKQHKREAYREYEERRFAPNAVRSLL
jgi:hypothetical protein